MPEGRVTPRHPCPRPICLPCSDGHIRLDPDRPDGAWNDHLIFSKGHASPLLYSSLKAVGVITDEELLTFRRFGSRLEGHPAPRLTFVGVATGSLGQGLPIGVGLALTGKSLDRLDYRVWVLCGDGEMAEGSMWEAFEQAGQRKLGNRTAIVDVNRLGQTGETMHGWDLDAYVERVGAFGWQTLTIDGHDHTAIDDAYRRAVSSSEVPTAILARTLKGKAVEEVEDLPDKHGKPLKNRDRTIEELGGRRDLRVIVTRPQISSEPHRFQPPGGERPWFARGEEVATRKAYGVALKSVGTGAMTSWPWTARCPTGPTARSFGTRIPSVTSRCTSPSSR